MKKRVIMLNMLLILFLMCSCTTMSYDSNKSNSDSGYDTSKDVLVKISSDYQHTPELGRYSYLIMANEKNISNNNITLLVDKELEKYSFCTVLLEQEDFPECIKTISEENDIAETILVECSSETKPAIDSITMIILINMTYGAFDKKSGEMLEERLIWQGVMGLDSKLFSDRPEYYIKKLIESYVNQKNINGIVRW